MFYLPLIISFFSLFFTLFLIRKIQKIPQGSGKKIAVFHDILKKRLSAFKKQLRTIGLLTAFLFFLILLTLGFKTAIGLLLGFCLAESVGLAGIYFSAQSSIRVVEGSCPPLKCGLIIGLLAIGSGLFSVSILFALTQSWQPLAALSLGVVLTHFFLKSENINLIMNLLGSYLMALAGATALIILNFPGQNGFAWLPIFLSSAAILALILISFFLKIGEGRSIVAIIFLFVLGFLGIIKNFIVPLGLAFWPHYFSVLLGLLLFGALFLTIRHVFFRKYQSVLLICLGILISFWLAGSLGFVLFSVSLLSLAGIALVFSMADSIAETAKQITQDSGETSNLSFIGHNLKETLNSYIALSANFAVLCLFFAYLQEVRALADLSLENYQVLIGLFLGGLLFHFFVFRDKKPKIFFPVLLALPVLISFLFGPGALAGFLIGSLIAGTLGRVAVDPIIKVLNVVALLAAGFVV